MKLQKEQICWRCLAFANLHDFLGTHGVFIERGNTWRRDVHDLLGVLQTLANVYGGQAREHVNARVEIERHQVLFQLSHDRARNEKRERRR